MFTVQCIDCTHIFGDDEDEFGICPECGTQQPASGSWAKEEMSHIEFLESEGKYAEAVSDAMELLFMATDIHYGDWPFAHKLAEIIRRLCKLGDLTEELAKHEHIGTQLSICKWEEIPAKLLSMKPPFSENFE